MAQGQLKKPSSQLAKGHKKAQNKQLSKGTKVFKAKNTTIRKGQVKQAEITKHINRKNELELASRAAAVGGTTGSGNVGRFTILKGLVSEGKKLNEKGGTKKKSKVKSGSKR